MSLPELPKIAKYRRHCSGSGRNQSPDPERDEHQPGSWKHEQVLAAALHDRSQRPSQSCLLPHSGCGDLWRLPLSLWPEQLERRFCHREDFCADGKMEAELVDVVDERFESSDLEPEPD